MQPRCGCQYLRLDWTLPLGQMLLKRALVVSLDRTSLLDDWVPQLELEGWQKLLLERALVVSLDRTPSLDDWVPLLDLERRRMLLLDQAQMTPRNWALLLAQALEVLLLRGNMLNQMLLLDGDPLLGLTLKRMLRLDLAGPKQPWHWSRTTPDPASRRSPDQLLRIRSRSPCPWAPKVPLFATRWG